MSDDAIADRPLQGGIAQGMTAAQAQPQLVGETEDVGYFDGSCGQRAHHLAPLRHGSRPTIDRRPLERWSWALFLRDRFAPISGDGGRPLRTGRTVVEVELQALVALLDAYRRYAGQGPLLLVLGDSQHVLGLVTGGSGGARRLAPDSLAGLVGHATRLAEQVPCGVQYRWAPRSENQVADRLASHSRAQQWGAEACLWWVSSGLGQPSSAPRSAVVCRYCAQPKPVCCPLAPGHRGVGC